MPCLPIDTRPSLINVGPPSFSAATLPRLGYVGHRKVATKPEMDWLCRLLGHAGVLWMEDRSTSGEANRVHTPVP